MPDVNFLVSSLPAYVATNRDIILRNFALSGKGTRKGMTLQTGVKYQAAVNFLEVEPTLQDGSGCGFNAAGSVELTQRTITAPAIKINMEICPDKLLGKYAEYLVREAPNPGALPFEAEIVDGLVASVNDKIEKLIWQGDKTETTDTDLKWTDGILKIASGERDVKTVAIAAGSSAWDGVISVFNAIPQAARKRGAVIFVAPEIFDALMLEMVGANLYHYTPGSVADEEYILPGTACRVVKTNGLAGTLKIVGSFWRNLVYGTDVQGSAEEVRIWWSDDDDIFKVKMKWNSGVQLAFPDLTVVGTFAATPVAAPSLVKSAASIATSTATIAEKENAA